MADETPSYYHTPGVFVKDNVAVGAGGVALKDAARTFVVDPEALDLGPVLGTGASSYVQYATHKPTGTALALKVMNLFDKSKRAQLVREIQALYNADCDCLVSFYGAFTREGSITIALEYCDCGTLGRVQSLAEGGCIPEAVVAAVAFQMLWALAYMRVDKRLHRDVKPTNVLVNHLGCVKLSDFGLSSELQNSILMAATFTGTCKYMSPERIRHEPYAFASDIWSFGLVVLECALGRFPYPETSTYIDTAETIVDSAEPRVPDAAGFTREFGQFVASCLMKRPEDRLPADILLGSPWFAVHGIADLSHAVERIRGWLASLPGGGVVAPVVVPDSIGIALPCSVDDAEMVASLPCATSGAGAPTQALKAGADVTSDDII